MSKGYTLSERDLKRIGAAVRAHEAQDTLYMPPPQRVAPTPPIDIVRFVVETPNDAPNIFQILGNGALSTNGLSANGTTFCYGVRRTLDSVNGSITYEAPVALCPVPDLGYRFGSVDMLYYDEETDTYEARKVEAFAVPTPGYTLGDAAYRLTRPLFDVSGDPVPHVYWQSPDYRTIGLNGPFPENQTLVGGNRTLVDGDLVTADVAWLGVGGGVSSKYSGGLWRVSITGSGVNQTKLHAVDTHPFTGPQLAPVEESEGPGGTWTISFPPDHDTAIQVYDGMAGGFDVGVYGRSPTLNQVVAHVVNAVKADIEAWAAANSLTTPTWSF